MTSGTPAVSTFSGFPSGGKATAIPNVFFTDLLPQLTDPADLAVILCAFRAIGEKRGFPRYITESNLASEPALAALQNQKLPNELENPVAHGLARAVELAILLPLTVERPLDGERQGDRIDLYFLNAPADRRGLEAVRSGSVEIGAMPVSRQPAAPRPTGIFALYESLIGTISPLVADELTEAERLYPAEWLEAAFREAAAQNARSWRYVSRILERWAAEGPDHATIERRASGVDAKDDRYFRGKYGRILRQRIQS